MSRLDQHVSGVRNKLAAAQFLVGVAYAVVAAASLTLVAIVVLKLIHVGFPKPWVTTGVLAAVAAAAGVVYGIIKRPTAHDAAVAIDDKLGLREKFSTALYLRYADQSDPFAKAAVRDAERAADNVSIRKRFPVAFPKAGYTAMALVAVAALVGWLMPQFDLLSKEQKRVEENKKQYVRNEAAKEVQAKLNTVAAYPKAIQDDVRVQAAKKELDNILAQAPNVDATQTALNAQKALQEAEAARQEDIKRAEQYRKGSSDKAAADSQQAGNAGENGPATDGKEIDAQMASAKANVADAQAKFKNGDGEQRKKAEKEMAAAAKQLQQLANDPAALQKLQQTLQQNGVSQQQVQQIANQMQQAAQGNKQAQQQVQQQINQMAAQLNGGKGPTQQQQAQIQSAMKQMQGIAASQAQAQNMAQAAQQVANAMKAVNAQQGNGQQQGQPGGQQQANAGGQQQQGAQPGGQKQGGQKSGQQQANGGQQQGGQQGGQQANGGNQQQGGQQPGGQQAGGQQGGAQPGGQQQASGNGSQPGQSGQQPANGGGGPTAEQQLAQAQDALDAVQKDAEQQAAQNQQDQAGNGQDGQGQGHGGRGNGNGPFAQGNPNKPGQGQGGAGKGNGGKAGVEPTPFAMKTEVDPSQTTDGGRMLAKTFVKSDPLVGKSTVDAAAVQKAAISQASDEVNQDNIPKDAQKVVKEYFDAMQNGGK